MEGACAHPEEMRGMGREVRKGGEEGEASRGWDTISALAGSRRPQDGKQRIDGGLSGYACPPLTDDADLHPVSEPSSR